MTSANPRSTLSTFPTTTRVPYFPPPPTSAAAAAAAAAVAHPGAGSGASPITAKSSRSPKCCPSALYRSRMVLVPVLLIITFAIVVLSVIFGYCVSTPHTQATTAENDSSTEPTSTSSAAAAAARPDAPTATLVFYLLTSPVALLLLLSVELILHHHYYYYSSPKSSLFSSVSLFNPNARLPSFLLLLIHLVTILGFTLSTSFWTACELPPPTSTALERLCPAQVRGHFMYGIHELSIAKAAMAWAVVVGLALHIWCQVKARRVARNSRRSRWALDAAQADYGKADVEVVAVDDRDSHSDGAGVASAASAAPAPATGAKSKVHGLLAVPLRWGRGSSN